MQISYYLTLMTDIQVVSTHWMIWYKLGHNPER